MRLSAQQINGIIDAITPFVAGKPFELRLYGSRVNDQLKGGDIDLLLFLKEETLATKLLDNKHHLLAAIKERLGDQKIDLIITTPNANEHDAFLQLILPSSLVLEYTSD